MYHCSIFNLADLAERLLDDVVGQNDPCEQLEFRLMILDNFFVDFLMMYFVIRNKEGVILFSLATTLHHIRYHGRLGCIILPKVIGFIDSPLNPIIWTTNSSPSEKFHKQGPPLRRLGYVYAVLSKALPRKSFCLKILLAMLKMTRFLKIFHYHGPKFEKKF